MIHSPENKTENKGRKPSSQPGSRNSVNPGSKRLDKPMDAAAKTRLQKLEKGLTRRRVIYVAIAAVIALAFFSSAAQIPDFTTHRNDNGSPVIIGYNVPDRLTQPVEGAMWGDYRRADNAGYTTNNATGPVPQWTANYPYRTVLMGHYRASYSSSPEFWVFFCVYSKTPSIDAFEFSYAPLTSVSPSAINGRISMSAPRNIWNGLFANSVPGTTDQDVVITAHTVSYQANPSPGYSEVSALVGRFRDGARVGYSGGSANGYLREVLKNWNGYSYEEWRELRFDFVWECAHLSAHGQNAQPLTIAGLTNGSQVPYNYVLSCSEHGGGLTTRPGSGSGNGGGHNGEGWDKPLPPPEYLVTFNSMGGTSVPSQQVIQGNRATQPTPPTRTGFVFGGWHRDPAGTIPYNFNDPVTGSITLYAKWIELYTVTFNSMGGTSVPSQQVAHGNRASRPADPTRTGGYTFDGWYRDAAGTIPYNFNDPVTGNITLYAKWIPPSIVTFETNGGEPRPPPQTVPYNGLVVRPPDPRLGSPHYEEYFFVGWYRDTALTIPWNFGSDRVTGNMTLYAKYERNPWFPPEPPIDIEIPYDPKPPPNPGDVDIPLWELPEMPYIKPDVPNPVGDPPGVNSPVGDAPGVNNPVGEAPGVNSPVGDAPGVNNPVGEAPGVNNPVGEAPGVNNPVGDPPGVKKPVGDPPGVKNPVGDPPGVKNPVGEAPEFQIPVIPPFDFSYRW